MQSADRPSARNGAQCPEVLENSWITITPTTISDMPPIAAQSSFFFFNDTATSEIYTIPTPDQSAYTTPVGMDFIT